MLGLALREEFRGKRLKGRLKLIWHAGANDHRGITADINHGK